MQSSIPIVTTENIGTGMLGQPSSTNRSCLVLERGILRKQSYVRLLHVYEVPFSMLRTYAFGPHAKTYKPRISQISYDVLISALDIEAEIYEPSNTLFETSSTRLKKLAQSQILISTAETIKQPLHENALETISDSPRYDYQTPVSGPIVAPQPYFVRNYGSIQNCQQGATYDEERIEPRRISRSTMLLAYWLFTATDRKIWLLVITILSAVGLLLPWYCKA